MRSSPSTCAATPQRDKPGRGGAQPVALLHFQLGETLHPRLALGEGGEAGEHRIFVDHRRSAFGRHVHALQRARLDAQIAHGLAALEAVVEQLDIGAHRAQGVDEAAPRRIEQHVLDHDVRARRDQRGGDHEGGRAWIARHGDARAIELGVAANGHRPRSLPAILGDQFGAEIAEHALGMIAARQRLDHGGAARRMHAGEQHRGLNLRRRYRQVVDDGQEIVRAAHHERQRRMVLIRVGLQAHGGERGQHPPHRTPA